MITEIFTSSQLDRAAELLKRGELVAFPTETVYGLGANIFDEKAISKVFIAKGRPSDNPLIAHIADFDDLTKITCKLSSEAYSLIEAFFPGPLTLLLPSHAHVPHLARADLPFLAVRMPHLKLARDLIRLAGTPLVAPSANLSGRPSATSAQHVLDDLGGKIAGVIDGGASSLGIESTIVRLDPYPLILRPGSITAAQIEEVVKRPVRFLTHKPMDKPLCPGMKYRHYAPQGRVILSFSEEQLQQQLSQSSVEKRVIFSSLSAHDLYKELRQADAQHCEEIFICCNASMTQDLALMNRLFRASEV